MHRKTVYPVEIPRLLTIKPNETGNKIKPCGSSMEISKKQLFVQKSDVSNLSEFLM